MATPDEITEQRLAEWAEVLQPLGATPLMLIGVTNTTEPAKFIICTPDGLQVAHQKAILHTVLGQLILGDADGFERPG